MSHAQESSITDTYEPESRFQCPICLMWLRDPIITSCGHRFCRACMESWLERENPTCPIDNTPLKRDVDIFPDNFTRREISQQKSKCPNLGRGCLVELSPLDIELHAESCQFRLMVPTLPDNEKLRCGFVTVGCEGKFEDEMELQRHLDQEIQTHLTLLSRAFSKLSTAAPTASGSSIALESNFWDPPSKTVPPTDTQALLHSLFAKNVQLEQKCREYEIIHANITSQLTTLQLSHAHLPLRYCNGTFIWRMREFRTKIARMQTDPKEFQYSKGFYTAPNGYKLCLRANLSPRAPTYLAILVHLMRSEHDAALEWPFSARLTITIVHPSEAGRCIRETMMTRPELEAFKRPVRDMNPKGFGYTEFGLIEELLGQGFVDSSKELMIKVQAQPI